MVGVGVTHYITRNHRTSLNPFKSYNGRYLNNSKKALFL